MKDFANNVVGRVGLIINRGTMAGEDAPFRFPVRDGRWICPITGFICARAEFNIPSKPNAIGPNGVCFSVFVQAETSKTQVDRLKI